MDRKEEEYATIFAKTFNSNIQFSAFTIGNTCAGITVNCRDAFLFQFNQVGVFIFPTNI